MPFYGLFWLVVMVRTLDYILQGTSGRLGSRLLVFPANLASFIFIKHAQNSQLVPQRRVPDEGKIARLVFVFFCLFADEEAEGPNNQGKHSPQFAQTPGGAT